LVRSLLAESADERILIFRNSKGRALGAAEYLAEELRLSPATDAIDALPTHDPSTSLPILRKCLANGTAFHTGDLGRDERVVVEHAFRDREGFVKVLVATTTVAAGINTPASTVILPDQEFFGVQTRPFTVAEYKNMAGRAGRLGYKEQGRSSGSDCFTRT
jgi:replicative superfamily II helicase